MSAIGGLHHVTVIAGDAQENLDFYVGVLGLRLVKRTVNQDVPGTYHLFYADAEGHAGTDVTFFPWPDMPPGRAGAGLTVELALAVPAGSLGWWAGRLAAHGVNAGTAERRFGELVLPLSDPHGLSLVLAETDAPREFTAWAESPVPPEYQIRGLHGVRLRERDLAATAAFLTDVLGFTSLGEEAGWHRFAAGGGGSGRVVDVQAVPDARQGTWGRGAVHHVAWRVADEDSEERLRSRIAASGRQVTDIIDRFWFKSVYFREPGGALFEIATDGPGFGIDESAEALGNGLVLPPWLESERATIEASLPPLTMPARVAGPAS
jgi:glyoxalase family protein